MNKSVFKCVINKRSFINGIFGILLVIPFFIPPYLTYCASDAVLNLTDLWMKCSICLIIAIYVYKLLRTKERGRKEELFPLLALIIWCFMYLMITVMNNGLVSTLGLQLIKCIAISLLFYLAITDSDTGMVTGLRLYYASIILINLILTLMYPNGLYHLAEHPHDYYFLGHRNTVLRHVFPVILLSTAWDFYKDKRITKRTSFIFFEVIISAIIQASTTSAVVLALTYIALQAYSILHKISVLKSIKIETIYLSSIILSFFVTIVRNIGFINYFVVNVLHKDLTFTGRTTLWGIALRIFIKRPLFGYGYSSAFASSRVFTLWNGYRTTNSCHNFYLDMLCRVGIIGTVFIVFFVLYLSNKIDQNRNVYLTSVFGIELISVFISCIFEPYVDGEIYCFFVPILMVYYLCISKKSFLSEGSTYE